MVSISITPLHVEASQVAQNSSANAGDMGLIPGLERSPGEGNGNPLQYSCLGNPTDEQPGIPQSVGTQRVRYDIGTEQQHMKETEA